MRSALISPGVEWPLRLLLGGGAALLCVLAAACGDSASVAEAQRETEAWRAKHEADYRRDWSTIAGLHFLEQGSQAAGSAPGNRLRLPDSVPATIGRFVLAEEAVTFEPEPGAGVQLDGNAVEAAVVLNDDGTPDADELSVGDVRMVIHRSGPRKTLRVWDPNGPLAREFQGFRWFDIQPAYRVVARFIPDGRPRNVQVVNTFGDLDEYKTEGVVEFTLNGETLRLRPFTTRPNRFYFVFKDASSGSETYEAARFLYSDLREDGTTVLDFNQAYNPPCAFNPYTTCPIPVPENRLKVKILAGERAYPVHVALPTQ
ncbi:MAG: DUF1684 domain-containing protein [Vicinamibacterales bacterium]